MMKTLRQLFSPVTRLFSPSAEFKRAAEEHENRGYDLLEETKRLYSDSSLYFHEWADHKHKKTVFAAGIDRISNWLGLTHPQFPKHGRNPNSFYQDVTRDFEASLLPIKIALNTRITKEQRSSEAFNNLLEQIKSAKDGLEQVSLQMEKCRPIAEFDMAYLHEHIFREEHSHLPKSQTKLELMYFKRELVSLWLTKLTSEIDESRKNLDTRTRHVMDEKLSFEDPEAYQSLLRTRQREDVNRQRAYDRLANPHRVMRIDDYYAP